MSENTLLFDINKMSLEVINSLQLLNQTSDQKSFSFDEILVMLTNYARFFTPYQLHQTRLDMTTGVCVESLPISVRNCLRALDTNMYVRVDHAGNYGLTAKGINYPVARLYAAYSQQKPVVAKCAATVGNLEAIQLDAFFRMNPYQFEDFCRELLTHMGIELDEELGLKRSGDDGLDGFGYQRTPDFRTLRVAIQVKRWQSKVSAPEIDKFRGVMDKFQAESGVFITTSDYTRQAVKASRSGSHVITLINQTELSDLILKLKMTKQLKKEVM